jgi:hypothetical protein
MAPACHEHLFGAREEDPDAPRKRKSLLKATLLHALRRDWLSAQLLQLFVGANLFRLIVGTIKRDTH